MGAEKGGPKSRGLFHIFDWNRKSRKKLFSVSPESSKEEKRTDANLNGTKLLLVDEDETVGISSIKGSSDYSCSSSVTDERNGIREPGVVARLMGLESIPTSSIYEPYSTPLFSKNSLSHKRSPEFYINGQFSRKPMEFRTSKMPSSPIERFQTETLPPRSSKAVPQIHRKLLSPMKNPGFISTQNAAHIMEAAAKILEPAIPVNTKSKISSSYGPLKVCDPKDRIGPSQRTPRVLESARRLVESADMKYLKGQSLNRSWNGSEDRSSQDISDTNSLNGMGKRKSVSLAIQAKVNVQKREGLCISSRNASPIVKDVDEGKLNQPFKSQRSTHKIKHQKKDLASGGSRVLRQNNQKQNCLSGKGKVTQKLPVPNQQERRILNGDTCLRKNDTTSKLTVISRAVYKEETLETCTIEHEGLLSSNKNFPQKKRLIEGGFNSLVVQPDVVINEQPRWSKDNRSDGGDVISFTFTSPLVKLKPAAPSSIPFEENFDKRNIYSIDSNIQRNGLTSKKISSHGLNLITGDSLSFLLEQKLRELTSGNESSYCNFVEAASSSSSIPVKHEKVSDIDSISIDTVGHENQFKPSTSCRDQQSLTFSSGTSSSNGQAFGLSYNVQGMQEANFSSNSYARKESDNSLLQPSPLSILEASFLSESCNSLDTNSTNGSKMSLQSVQALSDSASSSTKQTKASKQDLDYVRDILNSKRPLDHLLFDKLEKKRGGEDGRIRRKMMFDCVNECLNNNNRCSHFLKSGYQAWANGEAMKRKDMAENVYDEVLRWKGFGDCMIDELVDRDMSSHRGRWLDFKNEAFELGMEMEREIITSLVDEIFTDCM